MMKGAKALEDACRLVARSFWQDKGLWAYEAFEFINATYFAGRLPWPCIIWGLTAHGGCLGLTCARREAPPVITLYPSLMGGTEKPNPWGIDAAYLGACYAFDVLIHECIHVENRYLQGGITGPTSHDCPEWIGEVNRIAPLLGLRGVRAAPNRVRRVEVDGPPKRRGKRPTRVVRRSDGNVPHRAVAAFPSGIRWALGMGDAYYRAGRSPLDAARSRSVTPGCV
jgi:hypothetical protein